MFKFDHGTAKGILSDLVLEGEAIVQSGDLAQSRQGRIMHILGSVLLTIVEGIGADGWDKLHAQAASDLHPAASPEKFADGSFDDAGLDAGNAFRGRPGDGPTASEQPTGQFADAGDATGNRGDGGTRTNAGAIGDGNTAGNVGGSDAGNAGANTGGVSGAVGGATTGAGGGVL